MNKKFKLSLSKETLRALTDESVFEVQGGVLVPTKNATTCDFTDGPGCRTRLYTNCAYTTCQ
jgi:hypothetical protein